MVHYLLLIQYTENPRSKVWEDFTTVRECCEYVCQQFEKRLKKLNPYLPEITYNIAELYEFIDGVG
jgi:hypothetical protein